MKATNDINPHPQFMMPQDASVYTTDKGILVVDFDDVKKRSHCRDVIVRFNERGLTVLGKRVHWDHEDTGGVDSFIATHLDPAKVKEEYREVYTKPVKKKWWQRKSRLRVLAEVKMRVKPGWVEMLNSDIPFHITVSNYKIWWKSDWK